MVATIIISLLTFVSITLSILFFPKIRIGRIKIESYWLISLMGALLLLITGLCPINEAFNQLTKDTSINPLKILVLFFSMTYISIYLDEVGLFHYLANVVIKRAKSNQYVLFIIVYLLVSILTVFTSNDIVILTLTPFICFFCKNAKINPLPYLIGEFVAANTWSMIFIIGNPTNIYLAASYNITFIEYFQVMFLPTLAAGLMEILLLFIIFRRKLRGIIEINDDNYHITHRVDLGFGVVILLICLVFLIISSYINVEMWIISCICALTLLMFSLILRIMRNDGIKVFYTPLKRLPFQLIPFFLSMFVIVVALNEQGISSKISEFLNQGSIVWVYGYSSFFASNIINNIPMSILFSSFPVGLEHVSYLKAIYASIIGSNIGAFLTPIGALAGIMFSDLLVKHDVKFTFMDFMKYGVLISLPTISIALLILNFVI